MIIDLRVEKISISEALKKANMNDVIYLDNITYNEKIIVDKPNITLFGFGNTRISYAASHGTVIPVEFGGDGVKVYGTTGSATFTVAKGADGFRARGIIFENSYIYTGKPNSQAVAFKSECSNILLESCKFIGSQDTLYVDEGINNVINYSYIEGNVDFIFGSADCTFNNCTIKAVSNGRKEAYFTAPSTYIDNLMGLVFNNCTFSTEDGLVTYLGRPWYPGGAKKEVFPKVSFINCNLDKNIILMLKKMHQDNPTKYKFLIEACEIK